MTSEKKKIKRFYLFGGLFWLLFIFLFFLGKSFINEINIQNSFFQLLDGILNIMMAFGIFGIPIVFFFSFLIKIGECIINKIPTKEDRKKFNRYNQKQ